MEDEMTMPDGGTVKPNGQVILPDGTTRMMQEGEMLQIRPEMKNPEDMSDRSFEEAMEDEENQDQIK
jgi:hypothetical protein